MWLVGFCVRHPSVCLCVRVTVVSFVSVCVCDCAASHRIDRVSYKRMYPFKAIPRGRLFWFVFFFLCFFLPPSGAERSPQKKGRRTICTKSASRWLVGMRETWRWHSGYSSTTQTAERQVDSVRRMHMFYVSRDEKNTSTSTSNCLIWQVIIMGYEYVWYKKDFCLFVWNSLRYLYILSNTDYTVQL